MDNFRCTRASSERASSSVPSTVVPRRSDPAVRGLPRRCPLTNSRSTRFIVFDSRAKIITEHQTEFQQILPHAGWHEQDPYDLVNAMRECMSKVVENLEWMGWKKESIKGIGTSVYLWPLPSQRMT